MQHDVLFKSTQPPQSKSSIALYGKSKTTSTIYDPSLIHKTSPTAKPHLYDPSATYQLAGILDNSVVNGKGLRTVLFFSGCPHNCKNCQNAELQNYKAGKKATLEAIMSRIIENKPFITGVTLSGGDPFEQDLTQLLIALKEENINVWAYTGYTYELLLKDTRPYIKEMLKYIDVLVDGKFEEELSQDAPQYVGSINQRFIFLNQGKITEIRSEF